MKDRIGAGVLAAVIIITAYLFFLSRGQTFVHIDAIAHVNKARALVDNFEPGLRQLGTVWLPLPHLLAAPLASIDIMWRSGAAGSVLSLAAFIGTSLFLFLAGAMWTGSRITGWTAVLFFALNPRLIYLFTTPLTEPLTVFFASGLFYYLVCWTVDQRWRNLALAGLMTFGGTWTRYEGWALAATAAALVPVLARKQRFASGILFAGAACIGPMLWMWFNMVYFDDPLMFGYGIGSAHQIDTGKTFGTAGQWPESIERYFIDAAYALNPAVLWLGVAGLALSLILIDRYVWRSTVVLASGTLALFSFYVFNLYSNTVSILLPGVVKDDPSSTYNVRYGSVMAAGVPLFAALFVYIVWRQLDRHRAFSLLLLSPLFLPDPIPAASQETVDEQLTSNLFYTEAIHNQSFWMPPFMEIAQKLKADINTRGDTESLIMTNTRIVHVLVWVNGVPMKRFVTEMHEDVWGPSLNHIDPRIRWVVTEEGDQLWNGRGKFLKKNFIEVASAKTPSTGTVYLFRRPE